MHTVRYRHSDFNLPNEQIWVLWQIAATSPCSCLICGGLNVFRIAHQMAEIIWGSVVFQDHYILKGKSWYWEEENLCKEQESVESNKEPTLDLLRNGRHVANLTLVGQPIKQESSCWSTAADSNLQFRSKSKANVSDGWCWLSLLQVVHTWRWLYLKKKVCGSDIHLINSGDHPQHCEVEWSIC